HLTCGQETSNNITYFTNPGFPSPTSDVGECAIQIKKIAPEISQIRLDFLHFTLGQPNRLTGDCDSDVFIVGSGLVRDMRLCGSNSGHHMYFDVDDVNEPIVIYMKLSERNMFRLWEIKLPAFRPDDVEGSGDTVLVQMDETRDCNDRIMMPCDFEEFIM
ncbi:uncharacterized protein LOC103522400, partial [Diaphorina citri]|uniref:Uncharacterized protein LOC103522400 n=1 Tax=Diaphorina citri TaxID=121845 RepID=A0A1S3DPW7_DIACI